MTESDTGFNVGNEKYETDVAPTASPTPQETVPSVTRRLYIVVLLYHHTIYMSTYKLKMFIPVSYTHLEVYKRQEPLSHRNADSTSPDL